MNNFIFVNPVKIIFGKGQISQLSSEIAKGTKLMMTYGGGSIKHNGVYDQVVKALKDCDVIEFGGIEPNPDYDTLMRAVAICKKEQVDMLLAVGGGSIIDGTKFIAAAVNYDGDPWDFLIGKANVPAALTFGSVLTLPATASEMNSGSVISRRKTNEKYAFSNVQGFPKFSILDPECVYSLPKKQISNGIVDTFIHLLEQYLTTTVSPLVMDRYSEGVLKTLIELAPELLSDRPSYETCANYMLCATMGLNGFTSMGVDQDWATHMIGHELTALCGLDHGATLAIVYPGTMNIMRDEKEAKILQYADRVWGITRGSTSEIIDEAIDRTDDFFLSLGMKTRLSDFDIDDSVIDEIVRRFEKRGWNLGEHQTVTPAKVRAILKDRK